MTLIRKAFGAATATYNRAVTEIRDEYETLYNPEDPRKKLSLKTMQLKKLRLLCVRSDSQLLDDIPKLAKVNSNIRDAAVREVKSAIKGMFTRLKNGTLRIAEDQSPYTMLEYRSKQDPARTISVYKKYYRNGVFYPMYFGKTPIRCTEELPKSLPHDSKLMLTRCGKVYLIVPYDNPYRAVGRETVTARRDIVAVDPGVRTFGSCYDGKHFTEWGVGDVGKFDRHSAYMSRLQERVTNAKNKRRKRYLERALDRMRDRHGNWVRDLHYRFAHWLCRNYSTILWPFYRVHGMVNRERRRINSDTARRLLGYAPSRFRDILIRVSRQYKDRQVIVVSEHGTTGTCGVCGTWNDSVGASKVFRCPSCGFRADRDLNAARNILLRFLTELHHLECNVET